VHATQVLEWAVAPSNAARIRQDNQEARYVVLHSNKKRQTPASVSENNVDDGGRTPSTSVALIILYSITGIITALFLLIIVTGAIRAHRHPERYGPRPAARFGRPRQSRAKGLARAVLDTLPIVPFGANREDTEKPADVEMHDQATNAGAESPQSRPATKEGPLVATEGGLVGIASSAPTDEPAGSREERDEPATQPDLDLNQCPVCLEDFEEGQEVRVLPCHHNFHPDCIDPWLLNVSGSCPMCRIDLHPVQEEEPEQIEEIPEDDPSTHPQHHRNSRFSRYLDLARGTSGDERMAALRQLREENRQTVRGDQPRSHRLEIRLSKLRRVFWRRH